jgi:hypothetical protein
MNTNERSCERRVKSQRRDTRAIRIAGVGVAKEITRGADERVISGKVFGVPCHNGITIPLPNMKSHRTSLLEADVVDL